MQPEPPPRLTAATAAVAALAAALPGTIAGLALNDDLAAGGLLNPDSAMRLARLHDILATGTPLHAVLRDNAGAGTLLHWSHLVDSLLLLPAAPLAPLLGWPGALHATALLAGPATLAGLGVALAWAAAPYAPRAWAWIAAAAAGTAPGVAGYGMTGVVHHHILLALCATMAGACALRLLRTASPPAALALGAWAGAGLWLSPESLPFSLMAFGALWLAWLLAPRAALAAALVTSGTAFALVATLAWLVDPPAAGYAAIEPDRLSLPFILLAAATLAAGLLARHTAHRPLTLAAILALAASWLLAFPQVLHGTEALLPPAVVAAMFDGIQEMQPVRTLSGAAEALLGGAFAVAVLAVLTLRTRSPLALYALACAAMLVALGALHVRFATYPAILGAALLPLALAGIDQLRIALPLRSLARLGLVLPLLLVPMLAPTAAEAGPQAAPAPAACRISGAVALLAPHPGAIVLSGVNAVPELLYRTRARTVGSLYHRTPSGFMRLRAAWRSTPGPAAPTPELAATRATLLLACPGAPRPALLQDLPPTTLLDAVEAGHPPPWLHRLADAGPGGYVLYAVAP